MTDPEIKAAAKEIAEGNCTAPREVRAGGDGLIIQQTLIDAAGLLDNRKAMGFPWTDWEAHVRSSITKSLEIIEATALASPPSDNAGEGPLMEDGPCFYCGEMTSSCAGNPGQWPLQFCQPDETGVCRFHHTRCVTSRLATPPQPAPDALRGALEQAKAAMLRTRTASIAGCEEGYGKPEKWADELFRSHGDLTASIKTIERLLSTPLPSGEPLAGDGAKDSEFWCVEHGPMSTPCEICLTRPVGRQQHPSTELSPALRGKP